jgi:hypothetical protein
MAIFESRTDTNGDDIKSSPMKLSMKDRLMITAMLKSALPKVNKLDLDDLTLK